MARLVLALLTVLSLAVGQAKGDTEAAPYAYVETSRDGAYIFKMVPADTSWTNGKTVTKREAFGVAYQITDDGSFEEQWRTQGWYAFGVYLSHDGRYLIRLGPWASDLEEHTDLAIAFYDRGKLLKSYLVCDLLKNTDRLEYSASHYTWRTAVQSQENGFYEDTFHLTMIDRTTYLFDIRTGKILSTGRDAKSKSEGDLFQEEEDAAKERGAAILNASTIRDSYKELFAITDIRDMGDDEYYGCSLTGPKWSATLTPRAALPQEVTVRLVLPVENGSLSASTQPDDLQAAIDKAINHPFVVQQFSRGATGLRMRSQGDRMHWNTKELADLLAALPDQQADEDALRDWAQFIIDAEAPRYTTIYLNTKSGRIVYIKNLEGRDELVSVSADGIIRTE